MGNIERIKRRIWIPEPEQAPVPEQVPEQAPEQAPVPEQVPA